MLSIGFNHRPNADDSVDSICLKCFMTVASGNDDANLALIEQQHLCNPADLAWLHDFVAKSSSNLP